MAASPENVTLRTIARAARTSVSTVSYALRNNSRLPASTRDRIKAIAEKLGYRPNPVFAAMMVRARRGGKRPVGTSEVIAYISAFSTEAKWRQTFPQFDFFLGARERAEAIGFRLEPFFYIENRWSSQRLDRILSARGIRGAIVSPSPRDFTGEPLALGWSRFALATIGYTFEAPRLHRVTADHYYNIQLAFSVASAAGYRRIGCVLPHAISHRIDRQCRAALPMPSKSPVQAIIPTLAMAPDAWSERALDRWLRAQRPDFILLRNGSFSSWLRSTLGPRTPPLAELSLSPASTVEGGIDEYGADIGASAVNLVVNQLQYNECGIPTRPALTLLPGEWRWLKPPRTLPDSKALRNV